MVRRGKNNRAGKIRVVRATVWDAEESSQAIKPQKIKFEAD